jgi:hypothetical protein
MRSRWLVTAGRDARHTGRQSLGDQERGPSFMATTPSTVAAYRLSSASTICTCTSQAGRSFYDDS